MFTIVGVLSYLSVVISVPVNGTQNISYVLATVLFYKDAKGRVMIASGPVPSTADLTVRNDISSRIGSAAVKVVPIFKEPTRVPRSLNIFDFIKDEYETVFVAEVPKRLSRNIVEDMWNYVFGRQRSSKRKKKGSYYGNETYSINHYDPSYGINQNLSTTTNFTTTTPASNVSSDPSKLNKTSGEDSSGETSNPESLQSFDDFIPNDIYYGIEKRCVNWGDGCNLNSQNVLNMSSKYFHYNYKRPRIVQWGPSID